ncbi:hypothetical protein ACEPPN_002629 [Leptodophora sp. 'Broadleaf-Isolate-01']
MTPCRDKTPVKRQNAGTSLQPSATPETRNGITTPLHSSSSDDADTTVPETPGASTVTTPRLEQSASPSDSNRRRRTIPRSHPREESDTSDPTLSPQGSETPESSQSTRADSEELDQFFDDGSDTGPAMRSSRRPSQPNHNHNTPSPVSSSSQGTNSPSGEVHGVLITIGTVEIPSSSQLTGDEPTNSPPASRRSSVEPGEMEASAKRGRSPSGTPTPGKSKRFKH